MKRGDIDGASFRFVVGDEHWNGDLRTVRTVKELHDVTVATYGAYPDASVELRSRHTTAAPERQEDDMAENTTTEEPTEERAAERQNETRPSGPRSAPRAHRHAPGRGPSAGRRRGASLRPSRRVAGRAERAELAWAEYEAECRALTVSAAADDVNQAHAQSGPFGFDQRYAWPAFPRDRGGTRRDLGDRPAADGAHRWRPPRT